ncbi:lipocalin-like domain-containing protein [Sphingobacterium corticibacter]|uniref:Lipocalin-like domain-containing protein n=1 Tax=Sphingobacterium corticibacter TaxID=2171749 RepID=A0A2T8HNF3_9SPHI|nr:lipocalin family protein [Sphingobacterium corticibacter]PVH26968.1 hypothetical protein DC487_05075 [Sphingobacterium corticibacter]
MKLPRYLLQHFAILLMVFGCSKENDPYARQILGTWEITHYDGRVVADHPAEFPQPRTITFQAGGAFHETGTSRDGYGSYTINGTDITVYMQGRVAFTFKILSIQGNTAFLDVYTGSSVVGIKIKK